MTAAHPARFAALDGLRGYAAVAVVMLHAHNRLGTPWLFNQGALAVNFFFVLSGFVLMHAYADRLGQPGGRVAFLRDRVIRLHPLLILCALPVGIAMFAMGGSRAPLADLIAGMIPFPAVWNPPANMFPLNVPSWTMFWEVLASLALALTGARFRTRTLVAVLLLFVVLSVIAVRYNIGPQNADLRSGCRLGFAFTIGMLLYRMRGRIGTRLAPLAPFAAPLLIASTLVPAGIPLTDLYQIAVTALLYPAIIHAATLRAPRFPRVTALLGQISYPLYLVHWPVAFYLKYWGPQLGAPFDGLLMVGLALAVSYAVLRLYDVPVRRALRRRCGTAVPAALA
jgi:peptidoglycan/LPS O-acetylase OafA/YrhL